MPILRGIDPTIALDRLQFGGSVSDVPGMTLTKRQRMLLGVLAVAGAAMAIDALLPGPSTASASPAQSADAPGPAAPLATASTGGKPAPISHRNDGHERLMDIVKRLRALNEHNQCDDGVQDPFTHRALLVALEPSPELVADPFTPEQSAVIEAIPTAPNPPALRISSIMNATEGRLALIDGQLRREGDRIDGWEIGQIGDRSVMMIRGEHRIRIPMDR